MPIDHGHPTNRRTRAVNGILAVSRAFGDRNMKGAINAEPDVRERGLERHDDFLVLATDGLWDVMTSQEVCNIVYNSAPDVGPQVCTTVHSYCSCRFLLLWAWEEE